MRLASRPPLARILAIDQAIRAGAWPNARTLALQLEVKTRTIRRDLAYMRYQLGAPLEFDPVHNGFGYAEPSFRLPYFQLTEGELLALCLAGQALRTYRGTTYARDLARAFAKVTAGLPEPIAVDLGQLAEAFAFRTAGLEPLDAALFATLDAAVRAHRRLEVRYWSASRGAETVRVVEPYGLVSQDGTWYAVGYCQLRRAVRIFRLTRVRSARVLDESFAVPPDFDIEDYLADALGIFRGDDGGRRHRVRLRFTGEAVTYIREKVWHPSQVLEPMPAGGLLLTLEVGHLQEVQRLALSWGGDCEVLEPVELRARLASETARAAARYTRESTASQSTPRTRRVAPSGGNRPKTRSRRHAHD
jgi:predicted DNA-binding transcriptional regulator YafY